MQKTPITSEVARTAMTAYWVALGRPEPNSFDTLTLPNKRIRYVKREEFYFSASQGAAFT